mmetsp:Transcript_29779/g.45605  ORF Transcript_29779/g.45605 Transcript_29779/m.45605 type:complete len:203 (+) Transcript_29779:113-721(+)
MLVIRLITCCTREGERERERVLANVTAENLSFDLVAVCSTFDTSYKTCNRITSFAKYTTIRLGIIVQACTFSQHGNIIGTLFVTTIPLQFTTTSSRSSRNSKFTHWMGRTNAYTFLGSISKFRNSTSDNGTCYRIIVFVIIGCQGELQDTIVATAFTQFTSLVAFFSYCSKNYHFTFSDGRKLCFGNTTDSFRNVCGGNQFF